MRIIFNLNYAKQTIAQRYDDGDCEDYKTDDEDDAEGFLPIGKSTPYM